MIHYVFGTGKNYSPRVFLEKFKYVAEEKTMPEYIADNIEISSEFDREDSDGETFNEEKFNEEN